MSDSVAPLVWRRSALSATEESARGTVATVTSALASSAVYNASFEPDNWFTETQREPLGTSTSTDQAPYGIQSGRFRFEMQIHPSDKFLPLLTMCGFLNTAGTYTPTANQANRKSWSLALFEDGRKKIIYGAAGTVTIDIEAGKAAMATFEGMGIWSPVTDASLPSDSLPTNMPYQGLGTTISVNSAEVATMGRCQIVFGAQYGVIPDLTAAAGMKFTNVEKFDPHIIMELDARKVATLDHYGLMLARTEHAISIALASGANTLTFSAPKAQRVQISDANRDNRRGDTVDFKLNFSSSDDWLSIVEA